MKKLGIKSIITKKYRPTSSQKKIEEQEVHLVNYFDYDTARLAIFEYIEAWYNRKRIHSSIGYLTPQKCEDLAREIA